MAHHVSREEFGKLVEQALSELPEQFAAFLQEVPIEIRRRPTKKELRDVGLDEDELLLGLYTGIPLTEESVLQSGQLSPKILIFQEDCELAVDSEAELIDEVRITVLHEIGHHFGMDEDDLDRLGYG